MFCSNCGKQINDGVSYCPFCGNKVSASDAGSSYAGSDSNDTVSTGSARSDDSIPYAPNGSDATTYTVRPGTTSTAANGQPIIVNVVNTNTNSNTNVNANGGGIAWSPKSRLVALLLCAFLGVIGVHRFYTGKIATGLLFLFTGGLFGIGVVVDFIMIVCGYFRDSQGYALHDW